MGIPFRLLSDEDHAAADLYGIPIARKHPKAWSYKDGFIQPAVFVFHGEREIFRFVQKPGMMNLWGAAGRPQPAQILDIIRPQLEGQVGPG
jgi:peroxiredoxin